MSMLLYPYIIMKAASSSSGLPPTAPVPDVPAAKKRPKTMRGSVAAASELQAGLGFDNSL